jgi:hypothetical protein
MRAKIFFSWFLSLTFKVKALLIFSCILSAFQVVAQNPIVTVRFNNPRYVCSTQTYTLDVEFKCNTANKQLMNMNVRFYYDDNVFEFVSFGEFKQGYGAAQPSPPWITTDTSNSGMQLFGLEGPWEYVNGAIKKSTQNPTTYLPTTSWLKLFCVNLHVDDADAPNNPSFCPSVIWDLKEDPSQGGFIGGGGVCITLVLVYPNQTSPADENVNQFNWQYDGIPGEPYGFPVSTKCISTLRTYSPVNYLPTEGLDEPGPVNIPVIVTNFTKIGKFNLAFEYDPAIMTYVNNTPNAIFNTNNGLLYVTDSVSTGGKNKITMKYQRQGTVALTLSDSSHLADLHFNYISGTSDLAWKTTNNRCQYFDSLLCVKCDQPYSNYYINGGVSIAASDFAPITKIDSNVAFAGNDITYAVKVWDFTNIHSGMLTLDYNPDVLVFDNAVPNAAYTDVFEDTVLYPGRLAMSWSGNDTTLTDESVLAYLTFEYEGGTAPLLWFTDGTSCLYVNNQDMDLDDEPTEDFYINGNVASAEFIWTGQNSTDWNNSSNWANNIVPDQFTNVIIDPSDDPDHWPTFTGNFKIGENCNNLTLNDNAQFIISGDLTIDPGHSLNFNGTGALQVGGNWTNSGIFNPGAGTVEFTGTSDGTIDDGVSPANYVDAYVLSTFTAGMTPITGGFAGPSGDDSHLDANIGFAFNYLGQNYSQARINTNGWISLNLTGDNATSGDNTILFNTPAPGTAMAPWWDDLKADANTTVSYKSEGTAPTRVFTSEWKNILAFNSGSTVRLNFQVKLYETTNIIEFCYGSVTNGTHSSSESASIGIKDATGGPGNFLEATHNSNTLIVVFLKSGTEWPAVNYRFTPPVANTIDIFNKLVNSKSASTLHIQRPVQVTGIN